MDLSKIDKLMLEYQALTETLEPLLERKDELKKQIQEALEETKLDSYSAGNVSATVYEQERTYYPKKKLEESLSAEQLKQLATVKSYKSCRISVREEGDKNE